jgi:AmmeMemoRadiSam system protein B
MNPTIRDPAVAGSFYPSRPADLEAQVEAMLGPLASPPEPLRMILVPHAGYVYSGAIAGVAYRLVAPPPLVVVLAPNHYGVGAKLALPRRGSWRTPLGLLAIDEDATAALASHDPAMSDDWRAHARDHALEVQLPFLQVLARRRSIEQPRLVTLSCGTHDLRALVAAGEALAAALRDVGRDAPGAALIVVSGDMSHYIPAREARALDLPVLEHACAVDPEGFHAEVFGKGVSACGVAPAVVGLAASRALGSRHGTLLRYGHSGEVTGDEAQVVAYAAVSVAV